MTDQPQVDNLKIPSGLESVPKPDNFSPLDMDAKRPGFESRSTPLDLHRMSNQEEGDNEKLVEALMQKIQNEKPVAPAPVEVKPEPPKEPPKRDISQQRGALMPFVDGFNGVINSIWNALKSLVPMKR